MRPNRTCSSLTKLNINVENFFDLLSLLDGRFHCLLALTVNVIDPQSPTNIHGIVSIISLQILRAKKHTNKF